jgi:CzcA family heavy metal efflux pump
MSLMIWLRAHQRALFFLCALLAVAGAASVLRLPVALFPDVQFPRVVVSFDAGDRPAEQMVLQVTRPAEEAVRRVAGVRDVRSATSRGTADVSVTFDWGTDMRRAALELGAAVSQTLPGMPTGTTIDLRRMDPTVFPILAYSVSSNTISLPKLTDLATFQLRPLLSAAPGVANVQIVGGAQDEYHVDVDPLRLHHFGVALQDVVKAVSAANVVSAVGKLEDHYKLYLVVSDTQLSDERSIATVALKSTGNAIVRVGDVATITRSTVPTWTHVTADGHESVLIDIYQQPDGNTVQIANTVKRQLDDYRAQLPPGVTIASWYDQSDLIQSSAHSVRDAIAIGVVLAGVVLYLFLRSRRIMLVTLIVVPAVISITVLLMGVLGMTFNIMSLGGLAAAVGLIIDDIIVMLEHLFRRIEESPGAALHARIDTAASEFVRPLMSSSAATLVIFLPLAFLSGITGAFFKALSMTVVIGLTVSFAFTWLVVPLLSEHLLRSSDVRHRNGATLGGRYEKWLITALDRPRWVLAGVLVLLGVGALSYTQVGSGFMPAVDEGGFVLDYRAPPGTSLTETNRLLLQVEEVLRRNSNVDTYSRRTGLQLGGGLTEAFEGDFFVRLKASGREPIEDVMDQVRAEVETNVPGLEIELLQLMEDLIGDLTSVPQPIEIKLYSDDPHQLVGTAQAVAAAIAKIDGVVDINNGTNPAGDALELHVDRASAAFQGLDADAVSRAVSDALGGTVATQIPTGPKIVGVRVWLPESSRNIEHKVAALPISTADGRIVTLDRLASVETVSGQPQIARENLKRMNAVTARISGRDLGSTITDLQRVLHQQGLIPRGMYYELGGLYQQQQIAFRGLILVLAAASALVFLLLLFIFESFLVAAVILTIPLLSLSAVFLGLWLTGLELNISAMMGLTMIVGLVTEIAIFYFCEFESLPSDLPLRDALILTGRNRARPIVMSALAAILTLLPLAAALGAGTAMQQPLAVAIISGLIVAVPLVLLVMPVLFESLAAHRRRYRRVK